MSGDQEKREEDDGPDREEDETPSAYMLLLVKETTTLHRVLTRYLFHEVAGVSWKRKGGKGAS